VQKINLSPEHTSIDHEYLSCCKHIIENGFLQSNRTSYNSYVTSGLSIRWNMGYGFPILTTKKVAWKTLKVELEGFIQGITDKRWYQQNGCKIWNEWHSRTHTNFTNIPDNEFALHDNDLGPIYGFNWNSFGKHYIPTPTIHTVFSKEVVIKPSSEPLVGRTLSSESGKFVVTKHTSEPDSFEIIFVSTGYTITVSRSDIANLTVVDPYFPVVCEVACFGNYDKELFSETVTKYLMTSVWERIIKRCYDKNDPEYSRYGLQGAYVCNKWLIFENFLRDISTLTDIENKITELIEWRLSRLDITGPYDEDNTVWVSASDYASPSPNTCYNVFRGEECIQRDVSEIDLVKKYKIPTCTLPKYTDTQLKWNQYSFKKSDTVPLSHVSSMNQIQSVLHSLKHDPTNRRMLVNAWNPLVLEQQALPPCHFAWQVHVINDRLCLTWYQRSADFGLGVGFNIASYGLLLHLLAKQFGYQEGILTGHFGDCHIYENHLDGIKVQMNRIPKGPIRIQTSDKFTGIMDWNHTMTELVDYNPHPAIKMDVAV